MTKEERTKKTEAANQRLANGLLHRYKDLMVGERKAAHELRSDERFLIAVKKLLELGMPEGKVITWLLEPCGCLDCTDCSRRPPRLEMVNSEVSLRHLMQEIKRDPQVILNS
ncbi:hypothetical protein KGO95_01925 [Patescibacteria group bacterium]|nr:hypothetical protein [Patescibacteria group bacterium]